MSSVRARLERSQRQLEQPEQIVETGTRRVALGASGPTMSTRQREQFAADQNETVVPSTRTAGQTGYANGAMTRTRDRMQAEVASRPEPPRPQTDAEIIADINIEMRERWAHEARESEQARIAARQRREADERAATERTARLAQIAFNENLVLHEASDLTSEERGMFYQRLADMNALLDAGAASVVAESIRASRNF